MSSRDSLLPVLVLTVLLLPVSCAYYNTFYNARESYKEAMELARQNPDDPVSMEEQLLDRAISGAAKVLSLYPESRWVDDAQLLLGDALLQSGRRTLTGSGTSDFTEAMMAYSSAVIMTESREVRDRANIGMGLAAMELERYNDAIASFRSVSGEDEKLFIISRLYLMEAMLLDRRPDAALQVADSLERPGSDSLAAELTLLTGKAFIEAGLPDSGAVLALEAGRQFGRGDGYYRALTTAAEAYLLQERPRMAVEVLNSLLAGYRSDLETAAIAVLNAKAKELTGDVSGALQSYRTAAELDRYREYGAEALYRRALLLESRGRVEDAIADLEELTGRSGRYLWQRLAERRKKDLELLQEYTDELRGSDQDSWLMRIMIAEKRIDLYGEDDTLAVEDLVEISREGPDMERALSLATLSEILPVDEDSSRSLLMQAYYLSGPGDLATEIEDRFGIPRGPLYPQRPSVVLEESWELIEDMEFQRAWERLDELLDSPWSRLMEPELLWAAYLAGESARISDSLLEGYLNELVREYPETEFGEAALKRLGGGGREEE